MENQRIGAQWIGGREKDIERDEERKKKREKYIEREKKWNVEIDEKSS